ncbi:alpha/beta fold hydrolase [Paraburkholderia nodosa]|uniref:alpha/beta fold hydrolase n=1 Tax=Paraburkholderia nodosa TaxID=392320 RepID=UPI001FDF2968|nr:alpha/beta fold hydrolase [Paraburkholderia nodosa]
MNRLALPAGSCFAFFPGVQVSIWNDLIGAELRYVRTPKFGVTRVIEAGRQNREALILMHGIGGHAEAYAKNVIALAAHYRVIAFDFVGHGLSEKRTDIGYEIDDYVEQLRELMDALDIERAHVSGESLGGVVAGGFAVKYPQRVCRIVLNTTGGIPIVSEQGHRDLQNLAELSKRNMGKVPTAASLRARMQWLIHESNWYLLSDELVENRLSFYSRADFQTAAPLVFGRLTRNAGGSPQPASMIDLESIHCEALLLWTRHNPIHDVAAAQAALPRLPHGSLYVMRGEAAHWPQYEQPDEFITVMHAFLSTGKT